MRLTSVFLVLLAVIAVGCGKSTDTIREIQQVPVATPVPTPIPPTTIPVQTVFWVRCRNRVNLQQLGPLQATVLQYNANSRLWEIYPYPNATNQWLFFRGACTRLN